MRIPLSSALPTTFSAPFFSIFSGLLFVTLTACGDNGYSGDPAPVDEGYFITDTSFTISDYLFDSSDCVEVFPAGSVSSDDRDPDAAASLRIISTACYHVRVRVLNEAKDTVRTFDSRFAIFNRTEEEKNRGMVGYISWNGKDDEGKAVPEGVYLWRMEFDFGSGRIRKFRTDFLVR